MAEATLQVEVLSEWLVSGELDRSSGADSSQVRDSDGLPYIPGRSLRGLLRDACETVAKCAGLGVAPGYVEELFGTKVDDRVEDKNAIPGTLAVSDAVLPSEVADAIEELKDPNERKSVKTDLCAIVARTAVEENGGAKEHSLRRIEVGIPGLVFLGRIEAPDDRALQLLAFSAGLVRSLGASRYRGLGRCRLSLWQSGRPVEAAVPIGSRASGGQS